LNIAVNTRLLKPDGHKEGLARYTFEILQRLVVLHPEHNFFFFFDRPYSEEFLFAKNVTPVIIRPQARHPVLFYLWFEWALPYYIKKYKINLFFSPDNFCSLSLNIPQILTVHDLVYRVLPETIPFAPRKYYEYYMPKFINKADKIISVSHSVKEDILTLLPQDQFNKVEVIYNALASSFQGKNNIHNRPLSKKYFIVVGSINPRKNTERILKAFNLLLNKTGEDLKVVVVGSIMWKNQKSSPIWNELLSKNKLIHIQGATDDEVFNYIAHAEALVFTSLNEGFGFPILEGWASRVPVITSNNTSMKEIGGDAVLLADPYDVEDISSKMLQVLTDEKLSNTLVHKGSASLSLFSWDKAAKRVGEIINDLIL
jgi:glycosyltransferase involved in cell wall biosynthesis